MTSNEEYGMQKPEERKAERIEPFMPSEEEQADLFTEAPDFTDGTWIQVRRPGIRKLIESNGDGVIFRWVLTGATEVSHRKRVEADGAAEFVTEPPRIPQSPEIITPEDDYASWRAAVIAGRTGPKIDPKITGRSADGCGRNGTAGSWLFGMRS